MSGKCAFPGLNATFCFLWFTNCVLLSDDNSLIPGCLWLLVFVFNNTLILGIWCSTILHLPGCFCPRTFFQNIGFNMVPLDSFVSHLATIIVLHAIVYLLDKIDYQENNTLQSRMPNRIIVNKYNWYHTKCYFLHRSCEMKGISTSFHITTENDHKR